MNSGKRILIIEIVDDETAVRGALREKLASEGFAVLEAKDGEEGLEIALSQHPDLILLDLRMPKMDGMTMMHKLREDAWGKKASIIILTNLDTDDKRLYGVITDQPSYYLIKASTSLEKLLEKIQTVFESKKTAENNLQA